MKVADSALYTVTRASGGGGGGYFSYYPTSCVIFLISPLVGSPRQVMVTHHVTKHLTHGTPCRYGAPGIPSVVLIASGIYYYIPDIALAAMC